MYSSEHLLIVDCRPFYSGQKSGQGRGRMVNSCDLKLDEIGSDSKYISTESVSQANEPKESVPRKSNRDSHRLEHSFKFKSVYPFWDEHRRKLISMITSEDMGLVDYIFYTGNSPNLRLCSYRKLMDEANASTIRMPNELLGSDHYALSAKFFVK